MAAVCYDMNEIKKEVLEENTLRIPDGATHEVLAQPWFQERSYFAKVDIKNNHDALPVLKALKDCNIECLLLTPCPTEAEWKKAVKYISTMRVETLILDNVTSDRFGDEYLEPLLAGATTIKFFSLTSRALWHQSCVKVPVLTALNVTSLRLEISLVDEIARDYISGLVAGMENLASLALTVTSGNAVCMLQGLLDNVHSLVGIEELDVRVQGVLRFEAADSFRQLAKQLPRLRNLTFTAVCATPQDFLSVVYAGLTSKTVTKLRCNVQCFEECDREIVHPEVDSHTQLRSLAIAAGPGLPCDAGVPLLRAVTSIQNLIELQWSDVMTHYENPWSDMNRCALKLTILDVSQRCVLAMGGLVRALAHCIALRSLRLSGTIDEASDCMLIGASISRLNVSSLEGPGVPQLLDCFMWPNRIRTLRCADYSPSFIDKCTELTTLECFARTEFTVDHLKMLSHLKVHIDSRHVDLCPLLESAVKHARIESLTLSFNRLNEFRTFTDEEYALVGQFINESATRAFSSNMFGARPKINCH